MASVREAARIIEDAERPVIVAGGGAVASSAGHDIVKIAEMLSIPVATSLNGKGTIVETHPLSVGVVGSYSRWCANQVVKEGVLTVGIGDGGNEIGMGNIYDTVRKVVPYGDQCKCPAKCGIADSTLVDVTVVATVSNWGAYGIEACLAALSG
jgi:thiamine pyrophosphate-dependent acetolactate synthase large subunit-like protein